MEKHRDTIFSHPHWYDIAFSWDLAPELDQWTPFFANANSLLIPACGTGRYAVALAQRGFQLMAFDLHETMLEYALTYRNHSHCTYRLGNMITMRDLPEQQYGGALLMNNSLRYILYRQQALQHFELMARRLIPHSYYLVEVGLNDHPEHVGQSTTWHVQRPDVHIETTWTCERMTHVHIIDHIEMQIETPTDTTRLESRQAQLHWTYAQVLEMLHQTPFTLDHAYDASRRQPVTEQVLRNTPGKYLLALKRSGRCH